MTSSTQSAQIRQLWKESKSFRVALIFAAVYALIRFLAQVMLILSLWLPEVPEDAIPNDLRDYLNAAHAIRTHSELYPSEIERWEFYQYAPSFASVFTVFTLFSSRIVVIIHTLLHVLAYVLLFRSWDRIFGNLKLDSMRVRLARSFPIWLIFAAFWADLGYLNIYIIVALLATLLIESVLEEQLFPSILWASIILQIKPHWAFAIALPLILGRYRFFIGLILGCVAAYISITGITILIIGPSYGWEQYQDYYHLLTHLLDQNHPWRTASDGFLGYNHSITQISVFLLGISEKTLRLSTAIRIFLLIPLGLTSLRLFINPVRQPLHSRPLLSLSLVFGLYLGVFVWLDAVWELSLSIVVFVFLLETASSKWVTSLVRLSFLPYALTDCWQLLSVAIFGPSIVTPGFYILSDPNIYIPLIMILTLIFYALLVQQLWRMSPPLKKLGVSPQ